MAVTISASVGRGGSNRDADVRSIKTLLNGVPAHWGGPTAPLGVDGRAGVDLDHAVERFQRHHFGQRYLHGSRNIHDGRVDVHGLTLRRLNEIAASREPRTAAPV